MQDSDEGEARCSRRGAVLFLVGWKVVFAAVVLAAVALFPGAFDVASYQGNFHGIEDRPPTRLSHLATWDAQHYLHLAAHGYVVGHPSSAYFPLWPWAIRAAAPLLGGARLLASVVLANLFSIAAAYLFYLVARRVQRQRGTAEAALLFLIAYPGALFFSFPYSESLFLLLAVGLGAALITRRWWTAVLVAFAMPLARAPGVFAIVPLTFAWWTDGRREGRFDWRRAVGIAAPVAGLAAYFLFVASATGDPLSGFAIQKGFISDRSVAALIDPVKLVRSFLAVGSAHGFLDSALDRVWFVMFLACLPRLWRIDRTLFFLALPLGVVPALTSFMSYTRYLAVVFPVFLVLGDALGGERRSGTRWLTLGLFCGVQVLLVLRHINFQWAG